MKKKILIAGQEGMVGTSLYNLLKKKKYKIIECKRKDLDFTNQGKVNKWFAINKPEIVINAAGRVGGILDNNNFKEEYIYINSIIGLNLINASFNNNVKKFINLGSACIYPKLTKNPIKEEYILNSKLEETNEAYAIAKIAVLKYCEYIMHKYKKEYFSLQPANLYGENDNYNLKTSHVIPALIRKFAYAKKNKKKIVEIWGSGLVKREFLHVDDLANAIFFCLKNKVQHSVLNIGSGEDISIKELAFKIRKISQFNGKLKFNKKFPDGVKKRKLESSRIHIMGWKSKINLNNGLSKTYLHFVKNYAY
jgi:GDP-L-fucose synthase